jgi:hypothetical protein
MAKDIKIIIGGNTAGAEAAIRKLQISGTQAASLLEREFSQLGMKSALSFDNQRAAAEKAYQRIKTSGLATSGELERAQRAHAQVMGRIDEEQHGKRIGLLQNFKQHWLGVTAAVAAAWAVTGKAITLATEAAAYQAQGVGFANLAASYGQSADKIVSDLKRISAGTLSTQQLMESAGTAMLLGIEGKTLPKLMEIARASSRITGDSTAKSFADISLAVGRQSRMILDNLGIIVDVEKANQDYAKSLGKTALQLTDAEKKQAFLNATMEAGDEIISRVGVGVKSQGEKIDGMAASIDNLKKSMGSLISGPVSDFADDAATATSWLEKFASGQISFLEWGASALGGAALLKKEMENLPDSNFDASVTPEGRALAARKIEVAARKAAEDAAKAKDEAAKVEATARDKRLKEIIDHNEKIIAVEKKAIAARLKLETDHLRDTTSAYAAAVASMDSLIDARAAVRGQLAARNAADLAAGAGEKDGLNTYLDQQDEIKRAEASIASAFGQSAEDKAKAYADLIDKAAGYNKAVKDGEVEIISALQTESNYQATKEELQKRINALFDEEDQKRTLAAETFAEQMIEAQGKVTAFEGQMVALEEVLDRMNNKKINIIFKAQGADQLLAAANGIGAPTAPAMADIPQFATGTPYVPRTGLALIHQGERIIPAEQNRPGNFGGQSIQVNGGINVVVQGGNETPATAREIARQVYPELRRLAARYN